MTSKKYWYYTTRNICPVCGEGDTYRERRYTPRPENKDERTEWRAVYDGCLGAFI